MARFVVDVVGQVVVEAASLEEAVQFARDWSEAVSDLDMFFLDECRFWGLCESGLSVVERPAGRIQRSAGWRVDD